MFIYNVLLLRSNSAQLRKTAIFANDKKIKMLEDITGSEIKDQFKKNKTLRLTSLIIGGVAVLVLGYFLYNQFIWKPKNEKSKENFHVALNYAAIDSVDLAIAEAQTFVNKYDGTKGGENAQFTLARMLMSKGKFNDALKELEGVDMDDTFGKIYVIGLQGDCYSELNNLSKAAKFYVDAAYTNKNEKTTPEYLFKAGLVAESAKDFAKANELYLEIKNNYNTFADSKAIDKYIARSKR